jgi:hypothetical protein
MKNKKKIFCLGCSHTAGHFGPRGKSWPQILANRVDPDIYDVYNLGIYSNSMDNEIFQLINLIKFNLKPNLIILQWTTSGRMSFVKDRVKYRVKLHDFKNLFNRDNYYRYKESLSTGYLKDGSFPDDPGALHLNHGGLKFFKKDDIFRKMFEMMSVYSVGMYGHCMEFYVFALKQWIKSYLKDNGIPCLIFDYGCPSVNEKFLDINNVVDFIVERDLKDFKEYVCDDGGHIDVKGNVKLVEELIIPHLANKGITLKYREKD